jgi:hypothetical protein
VGIDCGEIVAKAGGAPGTAVDARADDGRSRRLGLAVREDARRRISQLPAELSAGRGPCIRPKGGRMREPLVAVLLQDDVDAI